MNETRTLASPIMFIRIVGLIFFAILSKRIFERRIEHNKKKSLRLEKFFEKLALYA